MEIELIVDRELSLSTAVFPELGVSRDERLNAKPDCGYWYCVGGDDLVGFDGSIIYNHPMTLQ